jgi:WD40 repeat protein
MPQSNLVKAPQIHLWPTSSELFGRRRRRYVLGHAVMAAAVVTSWASSIRGCATMALALPISMAVSCDGPPDCRNAVRVASPVQASAAPRLPGRVYVAARRTVQHAGTRDEVISLDPNTGEWRTEPIPPGFARCLRVSPSGTMAAYGGSPRDAVFACPLDGSLEAVRLRSDSAYSLTWAPDGERVIVTTCAYKSVSGQTVLRMETWMINVDGTGPTRLPVPDTHTVLDWSADGRFLLTSVPPRTQPWNCARTT